MKRYEEMSIKNLRLKSKTIKKIANISWAVGAFGPWFSPIPELKPVIGLGVYAYLALSLYRNLAIDASIDKNKEFLEFQKIYSEVLDEMVELSKSLDNKTIMEHYGLYSGILEDHMLSCASSDNKYHDNYYEPFLAPEYTLNGHGVCRHQAAMGCDFFSKLGIQNNFEVCYLSVDTSVIPGLDDLSTVLENLIIEAEKEGKKDYVTLFKEFLEDVNDTKEDIKNRSLIKKKVYNNHAIMKVNDSNNTYFLDTAQRTIYTGSDNPNVFCDMKGKKIDLGVDIRDKKRYAKVSPTIITNDVPSIDDLMDEYRSGIIKYTDNFDMIEKFNRDNKDRLERAEEIYVKSLRK